MISRSQIDEHLYPQITDEPNDNFVAAAVMMHNDRAQHAGIIIKFNGSKFLFHYTGTEVKLEPLPIDEKYLYRKFLVSDLNGLLASSLLVYFRKIANKAQPLYGYLYNGSFFDDQGLYTLGTSPMFMTCVTFCLNVIKGAMKGDVDFIDFTGWSKHDNENSYYLQFQLQLLNTINAGLVEANLQDHVRRITPDEYLAASYLQPNPVTKNEVNVIIGEVRSALIERKETIYPAVA